MTDKEFLEIQKEILLHHMMSLGKIEVIIRDTLDNVTLKTKQEIDLLTMLINTMQTIEQFKNQKEQIENQIEITGEEND